MDDEERRHRVAVCDEAIAKLRAERPNPGLERMLAAFEDVRARALSELEQSAEVVRGRNFG